MAQIVLDSWAVLAWLQGEPAGRPVMNLVRWLSGEAEAQGKLTSLLEQIGETEAENVRLSLNLINLGEVFYTIGRRRGEAEAREVIQELRASVIAVVPVSARLVFSAAALKMNYPMADADAFAVATAKAKGAYLLTGDPELRDLKEVPILWLCQD